MNGAPVEQFALLGPLPEGTTVLEASAGTGKTFTIAGLVTRYVAEGVARLDQLLVVTFGRAATQELRDRVRERLVTARDGLADPVVARGTKDEVLAHLAAADDAEVTIRRKRLVDALASFDAATVATTHQFCQHVLTGLGTAGDVDSGAVLVESLDDLVVEVVDDLYLAKWGRQGAQPPELTRSQALSLARAVVGDGQALLVPDDPTPGTAQAVRRRFALAVRAEVDRRKRQRRLLGFDDLLTRLRDTLADPELGRAATSRLRGRYQVVLVDEFQDTDPVQWEILRLAFHGAVKLVLIGDPKQAIYAFRGADVVAYLDAAAVAGTHATLARSWRSDPELLSGLDGLFRGAALGDERILVLPVSAAHAGRSLDVSGAPVRLRVVSRGHRDTLSVAQARTLIVADVVAEVVALLNSEAVLAPRDDSPSRPVQPGDLAVIVRSGLQLELAHAALLAAGIPAIQRTTSSVFKTAAATDWVVLLEALEQPHRNGRVRRLALSAFVGWDAAQLEAHDSDELGLRLRLWLQVLEARGIAALFEAVSRSQNLGARVLVQVDGERRLTDLRHVGEALHAAAMEGQLGLTASLEWLRHRVEESGEDAAQERSRRLDSDADAVQVVTIHSSKGLEFPVVYVPFGWDRWVFEPDIPLFHDDAGRRVRDVGGGGEGFAANKKRHKDEEFGEDLRLLYVALTRARAQVTAWWAPTVKNTPCAPLHRLLFTDDPAAGVPARIAVPADDAALARIQSRAVEGCLSVAGVEERPAVSWKPREQTTPGLVAAVFGRGVDISWRRTSYSALTSEAHDAGPAVGSEPEQTQKDDEPPTTGEAAADGEGALRSVPSPMDALPGGASFGTLVHSVLEQVDPTAADLLVELREHVVVQLARQGTGALQAEDLAAALLPALRTPLGRLADGLALVDIAPVDRLPELDFELPLCGGDRPVGLARLGDLASLLREHLAADDPMASYADLLAGPTLASAPLRGYLTGSIDAVLRVDGRYLVMDYKTNRLGPRDDALTAWHYRAPALADAMLHAHYPLQALLYDVALHRFLRWRVDGYDPEVHLGGVLYLFLRGMCGPGVVAEDGSVPGVFAWKPPASLVVALSEALARGVS